jgi:DoxX-like family
LIAALLISTFLFAGLVKLLRPRRLLALDCMGYIEELSDLQARMLGAFEAVAALAIAIGQALELDALTLAVAAGLVVLMAGAAWTHLRRRELWMLPVNLLLAAAAASLVLTSAASKGP